MNARTICKVVGFIGTVLWVGGELGARHEENKEYKKKIADLDRQKADLFGGQVDLFANEGQQ